MKRDVATRLETIMAPQIRKQENLGKVLRVQQLGRDFEDEKDWINRYHARVYESLSASMLENEKIWLQSACAEI